MNLRACLRQSRADGRHLCVLIHTLAFAGLALGLAGRRRQCYDNHLDT